VLTYGPSHLPVPEPIDPAIALQETEDFWTEWCSRCTFQGEGRDLVLRSLITLKALTYGPTGGIVAAPTTSLPEKLGGARNWDYRFCWLRDATFTLLALMNSGYTEEASAWHSWLLRAVAGAPANMQIMYGIMGQRRLLEWEAGWLPGYENSLPVRLAMRRMPQLQLDVYGELIDAFHQARMTELKLDRGKLGSGMRGGGASRGGLGPARSRHLGTARRARHYVFSKVMTWVAFDRAIKSAERFGFKAPVAQWRMLRDTIHRDVCDKGFDSGLNSFVESYGSAIAGREHSAAASGRFLPASDRGFAERSLRSKRHMLRDGLCCARSARDLRRKAADRRRVPCLQPLARDAYVLAASLPRRRRCSIAWSRSPTTSGCLPRSSIPG